MILHTIQSGAGSPVVLLHGLFGAARNFGAIQRALASQFTVIAMDMRNHGDSPHASDMGYFTLAADVRETLAELGITQAAIVGHSMGGKTAMALALMSPAIVGRLLVADIAPVVYQHGNAAIAAAMEAIPLTPLLTRQHADAALVAAVPRPDIRAFLLQNLRLGAEPHWRIGLAEIAAAVPDLEGWDENLPAADGNSEQSSVVSPSMTDATRSGTLVYPGPTLFVTGADSDYVLPEYRPIIQQRFPAARFVAIKQAGHWVHADNPAGFLSVLDVFLHNRMQVS